MNYFHVAPWEIILEYALASGKDLSASIVSDIIKLKRDLTPEDYPKLAQIFETSVEFWSNLQAGWIQSFLNTGPLKDTASNSLSIELAVANTLRTGEASYTLYGAQKVPVYVLTEQAYKYFLSKCDADEAWDLGFLGASEEHAKKGSPLKQLKGNTE